MSRGYGDAVIVVNEGEIDVFDTSSHTELQEIKELLKQILERFPTKREDWIHCLNCGGHYLDRKQDNFCPHRLKAGT